jgi:diacylglycerol kinase
MSIQIRSADVDEASVFDDRPHRRRSAWRQRLVTAERGLVGGVRSDSVFFVHFFGISLVIAAAIVLDVGFVQWIVIAACLTLVLTAEMFNQALKSLAQPDDAPPSPSARRAIAMGTAAVMVACSGSTLVMLLVFWQRLRQVLG